MTDDAAKRPEIAMIAAVARNGVIGADGGMPWHIPSDFRHFKRTTMGKPMVMGRKQFESVGRPLPGRTNIVVTRQPGYQPEGVVVISDLDAAIDHASTIATADGAAEVMIVGGGEIYRQAMERADVLYISHVGMDADGDVSFPPIDPETWIVAGQWPTEPLERDEAAYSIKVYRRRASGSH